MVLPLFDVRPIEALDGVRPITHACAAIGLAHAFENHRTKLFANGAKPAGAIKSEKVLGDDAKTKTGAKA